jgi:hypothetical protein
VVPEQPAYKNESMKLLTIELLLLFWVAFSQRAVTDFIAADCSHAGEPEECGAQDGCYWRGDTMFGLSAGQCLSRLVPDLDRPGVMWHGNFPDKLLTRRMLRGAAGNAAS